MWTPTAPAPPPAPGPAELGGEVLGAGAGDGLGDATITLNGPAGTAPVNLHPCGFGCFTGRTALPDTPAVAATLTSVAVVLQNAEAFEDLGVSAYNGAGKYLTSSDNLTIADPHRPADEGVAVSCAVPFQRP